MKKLLAKIARLFNPVYQLVYRTKDGRVEMYTIDKPSHRNEFGNVAEALRVAGFRAYCHNKGGIRSFRYDGVISLTKGA
jgi:hypothetical protein